MAEGVVSKKGLRFKWSWMYCRSKIEEKFEHWKDYSKPSICCKNLTSNTLNLSSHIIQQLFVNKETYTQASKAEEFEFQSISTECCWVELFIQQAHWQCQIDKRRTFYDDKRDDRYQFWHLFILDFLPGRCDVMKRIVFSEFSRLFCDWWNEKFDTKLKRTWNYLESSQDKPIVSQWLISFSVDLIN